MPTALELLFQIKTQGTSELDKVALATKAVGEGTALAGAQLKTFDSTLKSLVDGSSKTYRAALEEMARSNGVLSASVRSTASALLDQMKAAEGDEAAIRRLSGAHEQLTGNVLQARAAVQALDGQFGAMAAGRWLASIPALRTALAGIFSIVGPLAMVGVIDQAVNGIQKLAEKWDPVTQAEKRAKDALEEYGKSVDAVKKKLQDNSNQEIRLLSGGATADAVEADQLSRAATSKTQQAAILSSELARAQKELAIANALPKAIGPGAVSSRDRDIAKAKADVDTLTAIISGLQNDAAVLSSDSHLKIVQSGLGFRKQDGKGDNDDNVRKRDEEVRRRLELFQRARREGSEYFSHAAEQNDSERDRSARFKGEEFQRNLRTTISGQQRDIDAHMRVIGYGQQTDVNQVTRGLASATRGSVSTSGQADDNLQKRLDAAKRVYEIETRSLDLIDDEDKRDAARAEAQMKRDEAEYQARVKHEDDLSDIKERNAQYIADYKDKLEKAAQAAEQADLQKYQNFAGSIFDALTNRQRGAGFEFAQMLRGAARNTGRQVFENLATNALKDIGHATAGISGGQNPGGILNGTIFDPAKRGIGVADPAATARDTAISATARAAQDASDWLKQIYSLLSGKTPTDPGAANPTSDAADAGLPGGAPLAAMTAATVASLPAALASTASVGTGVLAGLAKATSGLGGFGSGMSSVLSGNALSTMLGYGTPGVNGQPGTDPSTIQQIGAGVGIAGALAAGGLGIASGISQGGARGDLTAAGSAAGLVGMAVKNIAPLLGAVSPLMSAIPVVGTALAAVLPLVGSLFGTGPQQRQNQINTELAKNQYLAPTAMNVTQGMNGTYEDFDAHGNLRTSTMSAVPTVAEPYITSTRLTPGGPLSYYNAPGQVTAPYTGSATGTGVAPVSNAPALTIHVNAIDTQSGVDFLMKNNNAVGEALTQHLQSGNGQRTADTIRFHSGS